MVIQTGRLVPAGSDPGLRPGVLLRVAKAKTSGKEGKLLKKGKVCG